MEFAYSSLMPTPYLPACPHLKLGKHGATEQGKNESKQKDRSEQEQEWEFHDSLH
jgi:hypothetical protein